MRTRKLFINEPNKNPKSLSRLKAQKRGWNARSLDREVRGSFKRKTLESSGRFYICFDLQCIGVNVAPHCRVGSLQQHLWTVRDPPPDDLIPDNAQQGGKKQTGCNAKGGGRRNSHNRPFTLVPYCQTRPPGINRPCVKPIETLGLDTLVTRTGSQGPGQSPTPLTCSIALVTSWMPILATAGSYILSSANQFANARGTLVPIPAASAACLAHDGKEPRLSRRNRACATSPQT